MSTGSQENRKEAILLPIVIILKYVKVPSTMMYCVEIEEILFIYFIIYETPCESFTVLVWFYSMECFGFN